MLNLTKKAEAIKLGNTSCTLGAITSHMTDGCGLMNGQGLAFLKRTYGRCFNLRKSLSLANEIT